MKNKALLPVRKYLSLFLLSISIVLIVKLLFNMFAVGFIEKIWDLNGLEIYNDLQNQEFKYIYAHKALAFFDQLGTFLIPSILFLIIIKSIPINYLIPEKNDWFKLVIYFFILLGIAQILLVISTYIGYDFLPLSTQDFLRNQQDFNTKIQEGFITESFYGFLFNIILLAVIPALGEELFFRGILQNICIGLFKNNTAGIIVTSLIFGILHFQIDNLLSIIFASLLLGYIYDFSNNIFLTILLHFGFNSFSLLCMQTIKWNLVTESQLDLLANYLFIPIGIVLSVVVLARKIFWRKKTISLD
ncbi:CPBP family intramembrane metalloprotease [Bacteroidota bacterium]|nr:CPBP family intramembrane metalloprotease [Bacteroidota bacterium]